MRQVGGLIRHRVALELVQQSRQHRIGRCRDLLAQALTVGVLAELQLFGLRGAAPQAA